MYVCVMYVHVCVYVTTIEEKEAMGVNDAKGDVMESAGRRAKCRIDAIILQSQSP